MSKKKLATLIVFVLAIVLAFKFLPIKEQMVSFLEWVSQVGPIGMVAFVAAYIVACVLFIPGSILTLGAGFAFGVLWGTIVVSAGSVIGATLAFLLGRTLLREAIEKKVAANEKFSAIDKAVARNGFKIVGLTRLSPVFPFNLLNYSYGLTKVSLKDYFFASWIGMLPGTVMYVYFGSAAKNLADIFAGKVEGGSGQNILLWVGLAATVAVTVLVTRIARKALQEAVPEAETNEVATADVAS